MIRRRGFRPYRPPQLLTGHIDDFPLVPETPIDVCPRPILPPLPNPDAQVAVEEVAHAVPPAPAAPQDNAAPAESPQTTETPAPAIEIVAEAAAAAQPAEPEQPAPPPKKRRKRRNRRRRAPLTPPDESRLERHQRLCTICGCDVQEEIDELFIHWQDPRTIAECYDNLNWQTIYRHAHATGLFAVRERNLRSALGRIVEKASRVTPTVDGVLRAIRAYSCLNADGQWTELPSHVIVSSGTQLTNPRAIAAAAITVNLPSAADPNSASGDANLPETTNRIETDATR
jgi:hypothetical protein